jgi:Cysteine-rich CPCC
MSSNYPSRFDSSRLTEEQVSILASFFTRRRRFDDFLRERDLSLFTCPCCGYPTLPDRGGCIYCFVCDWEDDYQDNPEADIVRGGPNGSLSLTECRLAIGHELTNIIQEHGGVVNASPEAVMAVLAYYDAELPELRRNNPNDGRPYQQAKKELLRALVTA